MKFSINDKEILTLSETQIKVLKNDILNFEEDMERRVTYIITHKYEACLKRLRAEWEPKLKDNGLKYIPTDNDELSELIFSQPNYQDREARDAIK